MMKYRLNGKEISEGDLYMKFQLGLWRYIQEAAQDGFDEGKDEVMFNTGYGSLVVSRVEARR